MPTTEMMPDVLAAASAAGWTDQPIFMVNLLRYNDQARYEDDMSFAPCTGREAYFERYVAAFGELAHGTGIRPFGSATAYPGSSHLLTSSG